MKVLMAISGGVDSAVAGLMLKEAGCEVVGAMMKVYNGENLNGAVNSCYGCDKTKEIEDAKANCQVIGCDFRLIDVYDEFNQLVFEKFKSEYLNARTPNPCVLCNPLIKFGVFPNKAKKIGIEFDKFATGHYAKIEFCEKSGRYLLKRAKNAKKDQTYFLYALTQDKLKNIIFPLGDYTKEYVRDYAKKSGLPVADKKDSQDFYFGSYSELFNNADSKAGDIVDNEGNVLGRHNGLCNYTIGQRKGLLIAYAEPLYVVGFDVEKNQLIVSTKENTFKSGLIAGSTNWIAFEKLTKDIDAFVKIRSQQTPVECVIKPHINGAKVLFKTPQSSIAPGQAAVFYDEDGVVLGGGTIEESIN